MRPKNQRSEHPKKRWVGNKHLNWQSWMEISVVLFLLVFSSWKNNLHSAIDITRGWFCSPCPVSRITKSPFVVLVARYSHHFSHIIVHVQKGVLVLSTTNLQRKPLIVPVLWHPSLETILLLLQIKVPFGENKFAVMLWYSSDPLGLFTILSYIHQSPNIKPATKPLVGF